MDRGSSGGGVPFLVRVCQLGAAQVDACLGVVACDCKQMQQASSFGWLYMRPLRLSWSNK